MYHWYNRNRRYFQTGSIREARARSESCRTRPTRSHCKTRTLLGFFRQWLVSLVGFFQRRTKNGVSWTIVFSMCLLLIVIWSRFVYLCCLLRSDTNRNIKTLVFLRQRETYKTYFSSFFILAFDISTTHTNLFIFRFVFQHCLRSTLRLFQTDAAFPSSYIIWGCQFLDFLLSVSK